MKKVANATDYLNMENKELFEIYSKEKNKEVRDILIERHLSNNCRRNKKIFQG